MQVLAVDNDRSSILRGTSFLSGGVGCPGGAAPFVGGLLGVHRGGAGGEVVVVVIRSRREDDFLDCGFNGLGGRR